MGILKSLGAPDTRQTCFFRSFFVIDLFYIAKVTSFYGVLFLLWLTIEKTGILIGHIKILGYIDLYITGGFATTHVVVSVRHPITY